MTGRLALNILHFARALRAAGLRVGTDRAMQAVEAVRLVGVARRDDVHAALSAVLLDGRDQQPLFDAVFEAFWRDPRLLEQVLASMLPQQISETGTEQGAGQRRAEEALAGQAGPNADDTAAREGPERIDLRLGHSALERLHGMDFEAMSVQEFRLAQRLAQDLRLPLKPVRSRRREAARRGEPDLRASLRLMARQPDAPLMRHRRRKEVPAPLVILIDISGSMERYARAFLHFAHGLTRRTRRCHTFVFGTRLTDISRCLRHRDPDEALALAGRAARDWRGGTRIGASLSQFNRDWARRVLTGNASLLLVTDGLERDEVGELSLAAAALARWAREIVWLNPLLRYDRFQPKASGVRALLPHVSTMIPVHNLRSLAEIGEAVARQRASGRVWSSVRPTPSANTTGRVR